MKVFSILSIIALIIDLAAVVLASLAIRNYTDSFDVDLYSEADDASSYKRKLDSCETYLTNRTDSLTDIANEETWILKSWKSYLVKDMSRGYVDIKRKLSGGTDDEFEARCLADFQYFDASCYWSRKKAFCSMNQLQRDILSLYGDAYTDEIDKLERSYIFTCI